MEQTIYRVFGKFGVKKNRRVLPNVFALLIVLLPVLLPYRFPFLAYSFSSVLSVVLAITSALVMLARADKIKILPFLLLALFCLYGCFKSSGINQISLVILPVVLLSLSTGFLDAPFLRKVLEGVSVLASVAVIFQTVFHYLAGGHIPMVITSLCTESIAGQYNDAIKNATFLSAYRPSAFFLEPAYFTQFCVFGLASALFKTRCNKKTALLISSGIACTTSGMGIIFTILTWLSWAFVYNRKKLKKNFVSLALWAFALAAVGLFVYQIPFVQFAVNRIVGTGDGMSAIHGRWFYWESYFGTLNAKDLLYGFGTESLPKENNVYFTGFMAYLWAYGIIGLSLYFLGYINLFLGSKVFSKYLLVVLVILFFFANQTNIISMIFNFGIVVALRKEE